MMKKKETRCRREIRKKVVNRETSTSTIEKDCICKKDINKIKVII